MSTRKQAENLQRQIRYLQSRHPNVPVYSDIGSGLNFQRRGLQRLLERALAGQLHTVHVTHRDRLSRWAYDLIEFVLRRCGSGIAVDAYGEAGPEPESPTETLANDLLSIVTKQVPVCPNEPTRDLWLCLAHVFTVPEVARPDHGLPTDRLASESVAEGTRKRPMEGEDHDGTVNSPATSSAGSRPKVGETQQLRTYRLKLQTTPEQYRELQNWCHAGRWAYNAMVAHRREKKRDPTMGVANEVSRATRQNAWQRTIHRSIYKNGCMDAVRAFAAERTRRAVGRRKGTVKFRSFQHSNQETIRLDAAQFHASDQWRKEKPKDTGPVMYIERAVSRPWDARRGTVAAAQPAPRPSNRIHGQVQFGGRLRPLGAVLFRDRRWLVDRLVEERWLRHEAKLTWNQPFG